MFNQGLMTRQPLTRAGWWERDYVYPFNADDFITNFGTLVNGSYFERDSASQSIRSGSYTYNKDNVTATGYLMVKTQDMPLVLTFEGYTSSESGFDYGSLYVGASSGNAVGTQVYRDSGDNKTVTVAQYKLDANKTYYLNFSYRKDSSNSKNDDRFYIKRINFRGCGLIDETAWLKEYKYPFPSDNFCSFDNLVDNKNFELDATKGCIRSGSASYHVTSGKSVGYIKIRTPSFKTKFTFKGYTSSEGGCDWGNLYLGSSAGSQVGTQVYRGASESAVVVKTAILEPNTDYYLNFSYTKDGSVDKNDDRFYIKSLKFEQIVTINGFPKE